MLIAAAKRGDVEGVRVALRAGENPNKRVRESLPLQWACSGSCNVEMAKVSVSYTHLTLPTILLV